MLFLLKTESSSESCVCFNSHWPKGERSMISVLTLNQKLEKPHCFSLGKSNKLCSLFSFHSSLEVGYLVLNILPPPNHNKGLGGKVVAMKDLLWASLQKKRIVKCMNAFLFPLKVIWIKILVQGRKINLFHFPQFSSENYSLEVSFYVYMCFT